MLWEIKNLNDGRIGILGHGGMGIHSARPLNSLASLQEALDMGADGVEMDIQMSRDSVLFVFHHNDLSDAGECKGKIHELPAAKIDCYYKQGFDSHKIMRLDEVLQKLRLAEGQYLTFECKIPDHPEASFLSAFARGLCETLILYELESKAFVEATHSDFLEILQKQDVQLKRLFIYTNDFFHGIQTAERLSLYGITMNQNNISAGQIKEAHARGFRVTLFGQKSKQNNLDAVGMSPDYIQTDRLKHLVGILKD